MADVDRLDSSGKAFNNAQLQRIGVRELRQHASRWLHRVASGESFEITDRGRPVAVLSPVIQTGSVVDGLLSSGQLVAPVQKQRRPRPVALDPGPSASEVLAQMRVEERY